MKARPNKLDQFAARLDEWAAEGKTLAEIQAALKADGCVSSLSSLSDYLARRRSEQLEGKLFETIASGGRMNQELDAAYASNPAPDIEQLIRVSKTLIMSLQVQGAANPKMLALANSMQQTVLNYLSGRFKGELELKKLELAQERFQVECCEKFLAWFKDAKAKEIAESSLGNSEKIAALRQEYFKDVDALQQSGQTAVKLPANELLLNFAPGQKRERRQYENTALVAVREERVIGLLWTRRGRKSRRWATSGLTS
jgi:hypothetical protein